MRRGLACIEWCSAAGPGGKNSQEVRDRTIGILRVVVCAGPTRRCWSFRVAASIRQDAADHQPGESRCLVE